MGIEVDRFSPLSWHLICDGITIVSFLPWAKLFIPQHPIDTSRIHCAKTTSLQGLYIHSTADQNSSCLAALEALKMYLPYWMECQDDVQIWVVLQETDQGINGYTH